MVSGIVDIIGTAAHENLTHYQILYAEGIFESAESQWMNIALVPGGVQVHDGVLAVWDTRNVPPGVYTLAISIWWGEHGQQVRFMNNITVKPAPVWRPPPEPDQPVNLSLSGAASHPAIVAGPGGTFQAFWWDQFDGLTTAIYNGETWTYPVGTPFMMMENAGWTFMSEPIGAMPSIMGATHGRVHGLWLGEADEDIGGRRLMYGFLNIGELTWSWFETLHDTALAWDMFVDPAGTLHLVYVRPAHDHLYPAGVHYRRSYDGGVSWSAPEVLYGTKYFRLLSAEDAHVRMVTDGAGSIYVTWDDPRLERAFYARSIDGGSTWGEPQGTGDAEEGARRPWMVFGQEGEMLLLWEVIRGADEEAVEDADVPCALYQQRSADGGETWWEPRQVLEGLDTCLQGARFLHTPDGQPLLITSGEGGLTFVAWNGIRWSEFERLEYSFEDPEFGWEVNLEDLRVTLVDDVLNVVGRGQDGEVWFLESQIPSLDWVPPPTPTPSPWSAPVNVSQSEALPGLPAMATDAEGRVHVLWSEAPAEGTPGRALYYARWDGARWTRPAEVLRSPEGKAEQPALAAVGEHLHAVWSGGRTGEILYSRAYVRDAYASGGWSEPQLLPMPGAGGEGESESSSTPSVVGSWPSIVADLRGTLHVVYAVPLNEERGIYYTRSDDGGETWSEAQLVFDATAAGWTMVDHPTLAVDEQGVIHAAWVRALPGDGATESIYYERSTDGGETWSEPLVVTEGAYDWPRVTATFAGQVHLLWNEAGGNRAWYHRWSTDGGEGWTKAERVRNFGGVSGPAGVAADGTGALHLVGLGHDDAGEPALVYVIWNGSRWGERETFGLATGGDGSEPGVAVVLRAVLGWLDVAFRGEMEVEEGTTQVDLLFANRSVPAVAVTPAPVFTPQPTATPTPMPTPTPIPTPRPAVDVGAPPSAPPALSLGPVNLPFASLGGLLLAILIVVVVLVTRELRGRRE